MCLLIKGNQDRPKRRCFAWKYYEVSIDFKYVEGETVNAISPFVRERVQLKVGNILQSSRNSTGLTGGEGGEIYQRKVWEGFHSFINESDARAEGLRYSGVVY